MKEENLDEKVPVRAYTKADLAMLYNRCMHYYRPSTSASLDLCEQATDGGIAGSGL